MNLFSAPRRSRRSATRPPFIAALKMEVTAIDPAAGMVTFLMPMTPLAEARRRYQSVPMAGRSPP